MCKDENSDKEEEEGPTSPGDKQTLEESSKIFGEVYSKRNRREDSVQRQFTVHP